MQKWLLFVNVLIIAIIDGFVYKDANSFTGFNAPTFSQQTSYVTEFRKHSYMLEVTAGAPYRFINLSGYSRNKFLSVVPSSVSAYVILFRDFQFQDPGLYKMELIGGSFFDRYFFGRYQRSFKFDEVVEEHSVGNSQNEFYQLLGESINAEEVIYREMFWGRVLFLALLGLAFIILLNSAIFLGATIVLTWRRMQGQAIEVERFLASNAVSELTAKSFNSSVFRKEDRELYVRCQKLQKILNFWDLKKLSIRSFDKKIKAVDFENLPKEISLALAQLHELEAGSATEQARLRLAALQEVQRQEKFAQELVYRREQLATLLINFGALRDRARLFDQFGPAMSRISSEIMKADEELAKKKIKPERFTHLEEWIKSLDEGIQVQEEAAIAAMQKTAKA